MGPDTKEAPVPKVCLARGKKWKLVPTKKPDEDNDEEDDPKPSTSKEGRSAVKGRPN